MTTQARRKQLQIGGAHINFFTDWGGGGAHINVFKMTDLCNEQYSIFVQIIGGGGGHGPPVPPLILRPCNIYSFKFDMKKQNGGPLNHNMLHHVISNMISLSEPLITDKYPCSLVCFYEWKTSIS